MLASDSIASNDALNRNVFARQIVMSLTTFHVANDESFVVGINGKWGSGKSDLVYLP